MARVAVVSGTATAVSNRVSRRQGNRWAEQEQQQQPQYVEAPPAGDDTTEQLKELAGLKAQGVLTDAEFAAAKAKILA
jgi:hypothetical protein